MKLNVLFAVAIVMGGLPLISRAAILTFPDQVKKVKVPDSDYVVPVEADLSIKDVSPQKLSLSGSGVRIKTVTFLGIKAQVYIAQSYLAGALTGMKDERLNQVAGMKQRAIELFMLRNLSSNKIKEGFKEALDKNKIKIEGPIQEAMSQVVGDMPEKSTIRFVGVTLPAGEELTVEIPGKTFSVKGPHIVTDFWKIWFGEPADDGLADLQKQLLGLG